MVRVASVRPETSGETPTRVSRTVGTYVVIPMRMTPTPRPTSAVVPSRRRESTHSGSTGSGARRSASTNAASSAAPSPKAPRLGTDTHAQARPPSSRASSSRLSDTVSSRPPAQSIRCGLRSTVSWKDRTSSHAASAASGTLTKKIHCQVANSENSPPSVGPTTAEAPQTLAM